MIDSMDEAEVECILYDGNEIAVRSASVLVRWEIGGLTAEELKSSLCRKLGQSRDQLHQIHIFRPLVDKALWAKGIAAVVGNSMTWERLCDRFLAKVADEEDVAALLRTAPPRFAVAIKVLADTLEEAAAVDTGRILSRATSPTNESSTLSPVSTPTSRWSPERIPRAAFSDAVSVERSSLASVASSKRLVGDLETRRRQLRKQKKTLQHGNTHSPADDLDSERYSKQMALLERVTTRWVDRSSGNDYTASVALVDDDPRVDEKPFTSLRALGTNEPSVQHTKEIEETKQHYVEALRCARRDVEKLRGAQQAALMLANRDEARLQRGWFIWAQQGIALRRKHAARANSASQLCRLMKRHMIKCQEHAIAKLRAAVYVKRAFRRGAAAALLAHKFEHQLRRILHHWRAQASSKATIQASAERVLNRATRRKALGAWNTWRASDRSSRKLESSLRRLGAAGSRRKRLEQRRAIDAWKQQLDSKSRLKRILSYMTHSQQRQLAMAFRQWHQEARRRSHRLRLALSSIASEIKYAGKRRASQSLIRAWRQLRAVLETSHILRRRVVLRMRRSILFKALQCWYTMIKHERLIERTRSILRRYIARMSRASLLQAWNTWLKNGAAYDRSQQAARRALLRMLRSELFHAWRQWKVALSVYRDCTHGTTSTKRILARWLRRAVATAWIKWRASTRHFRTILAPTVRRCLLQAARLHLACGFRCWRLEIQRTKSAKSILAKTVARLHNTELLGAWLTWLGVVSEGQANDGLLRRVLKRIGHLKVAQALDAWRAAILGMHYIKIVGKTLYRLSRLHLRQGWTRWLATIREMKMHDHAHALASSARAVACLAVYAGNAKKSSLRLAWATWLHMVHQERDRAKAMARFVKFMLSPKKFRASFRHWVNITRWSHHNSRTMTRVLRSMLRRDAKRAIRQWQLVNKQKLIETALLKRVVSRMAMNHQAIKLSAAWRTWILVLHNVRRVAEISLRSLRRAARLRLAMAFDKWHDNLILTERILQRVVTRMHSLKLATAFVALRTAVHRRAKDDHRARISRRIILQTQQRRIALAWRSWTTATSRIRSFARLAKRVLGTWLHREMKCAFIKLKSVVAHASELRSRLMKTTRRIVNLRLATAYDAWCKAVQQKEALEAALADTVAHWMRLKQVRAFRAWQDLLHTHRRAKLAFRAVAKILRKDFAQAWRRWSESSHLISLSNTAKKLHSVKLEAALRRVCAAYKGSTRAVVNLAFRSWSQLTWHYTASDSHRKLMIKKSIEAMAKRKVHMALRTWSLFVKSQRILMGTVRRLQQRKVALAWRSWLSFVRNKTSCMANSRRLLRKWEKLQIGRAMESWRSALERIEAHVHRSQRLKRAICTMSRNAVARTWRSWLSALAHSKLRAAHARAQENHLNGVKARLGLLVNGSSLKNGKLRVQASFLHWRSISHALQLHRSHVLQRAAIALKPSKRALARAFRTLIAAVHTRRGEHLQRQLTESQLSAAQKVLATTAAYNFFSACHVTSKAMQVRSLGRGFRIWLLFARDDRHDARRARADKLRAVPTLVRSALRFAARRAFATWEQATITASCRELAAQTVFDLARAIDELKPISVAFAIWRAESVRAARATNYDLALALAARPTELRHAALAGALGIAFNTTFAKFQHYTVANAFQHWRTMQNHRKAATLLSVTLGTARDALISLAFDHWSGLNERRRLLELRLAQNLCKRHLIRAWIHWWTQVEVLRELTSLQNGVRALVRVRGSHP